VYMHVCVYVCMMFVCTPAPSLRNPSGVWLCRGCTYRSHYFQNNQAVRVQVRQVGVRMCVLCVCRTTEGRDMLHSHKRIAPVQLVLLTVCVCMCVCVDLCVCVTLVSDCDATARPASLRTRHRRAVARGSLRAARR
jgi:hypothetical protein